MNCYRGTAGLVQQQQLEQEEDSMFKPIQVCCFVRKKEQHWKERSLNSCWLRAVHRWIRKGHETDERLHRNSILLLWLDDLSVWRSVCLGSSVICATFSTGTCSFPRVFVLYTDQLLFSKPFCLPFVCLSNSFQHQWERTSTPLHTFQQFTTAGIEEIMVSKPYGITVRPVRAALTASKPHKIELSR